MKDSFRGWLPSFITFGGLICAFSAVVFAVDENLTAAGVCILIGFLLDACDGALARRLGVASAFGLQLDSLVDVVTFGVAPGILIYQHLRHTPINPVITWGVCAGYLVGGVFRLARFNLLPAKTSSSDSMGLTISTSGATVALGVLANRAYGQGLIPIIGLLVLMMGLTLLMISRVRYPALAAILRRRWLSALILSTAAILAVWLSPQLVGFGLTSGYVSFGLARAIYHLVF